MSTTSVLPELSAGASAVSSAAVLPCAGVLDPELEPPQAAREMVMVAARRSAISLFICYLPLFAIVFALL
jgi:hypothetical protein